MRPAGRPMGEIGQAVLKTAWEVALERARHPMPGVTQHDVMARLVPKGVARRSVRWTWQNLVRSAALRPLGKAVQVPGVPRPVQAYVPVDRGQRAGSGNTCAAAELGAVLRAWGPMQASR
jgi:hypothetical protein